MTRRDWLKKNPPPSAAKCPTHQQPLTRHNNRAEDLFVCSVGPHYLLWGAGPAEKSATSFFAVDLAKPLPDLDKPLE